MEVPTMEISTREIPIMEIPILMQQNLKPSTYSW
jgi:hypothetical protein